MMTKTWSSKMVQKKNITVFNMNAQFILAWEKREYQNTSKIMLIC